MLCSKQQRRVNLLKHAEVPVTLRTSNLLIKHQTHAKAGH